MFTLCEKRPARCICGLTCVARQILEYLFESLKSELTQSVGFELHSIEACTAHMQLFLKNVLSLDKILDGSMALPSVAFSPTTLCSTLKDMMKHSLQPEVGFEVVVCAVCF